jgi:glycerol-3-phosphate dehydrogenase
MTTRAVQFEQLADGEFDLLIIGGGINGCGAARDAALRGLKVALVEQRDWASGTSSRSAKLVHGGLRYLATFQLGLVRESTAERAVQTRVAPHLVKPILFLMPVYKEHKNGLWFMNLGLWFYDALALFRIPKRHRMYRRRKGLALQPNLRAEGFRGALTFYDTAANDARLTLENALDAELLGAVTVNYAQVTGLETDDNGQVTGAQVTDGLGGKTVEVRARLTLNTTGPWTDRLLSLTKEHTRPMLRNTKGAHLVIDAERLPVHHAVAMIHPDDQRPLFIIPWGPHVYVGTTDYDTQTDPDRIHADTRDTDNLLKAINHYFPEAGITPKDIVSSWCGVRPLVAPHAQMSASEVSREHVIKERPRGLLTMVGGKLTTYRLMARELVDQAVRILARDDQDGPTISACQTRDRPLPGAIAMADQADLDALAAHLTDGANLPPAVATHLANTYGCRAKEVLRGAAPEDLELLCPPLPYVWAELNYNVRVEHARTLVDFFARRTQLLLRDPKGCLNLAPAVAERMGELLGWDAETRQAQESTLAAEVHDTLRCQG